MTHKEKAQELIHKFAKPIDGLHKYPMCYETSKQCALIAVNELIYSHSQDTTDNQFYYWKEVKQEIKKL